MPDQNTNAFQLSNDQSGLQPLKPQRGDKEIAQGKEHRDATLGCTQT